MEHRLHSHRNTWSYQIKSFTPPSAYSHHPGLDDVKGFPLPSYHIDLINRLKSGGRLVFLSPTKGVILERPLQI